VFDRVEETPSFWLMAALSIAAIVVEVVILVVSWVRLRRQKRARQRAIGGDWQGVAALKLPSRAPEIIATLSPIAVALTSARLIQGCRTLIVMAMGQADPVEKARILYPALNGELNAMAMGLWLLPLIVLVGGLAVALAISARLRARGLKRAESLATRHEDASAFLKFPGPSTGALVAGIGAFLVLGFAPIARAGFAAVATTMSHFAAVAGLEMNEKRPIFKQGLDRASVLLDQGFLVARAGVVVAALIAVYLAWRFSPGRARAGVPGGARPVASEGAFGPVVAFIVLAASAAAFLAARR
jgi:hypothetical protein